MTDPKVVLITGASSGIGYATALAFAKEGVHVVGMARRAERLQALGEAIDSLPGTHGEFLSIMADVRRAEDLNYAVAQTIARFGRLDILVANAGVGQRGSVVESKWDDVETLLRTNIDGVMHSVRAAVPAIRQHGQGGHIVMISSVVYNMVLPYAASYAASKAFVSSLARSMRLELEKDNIRVTDMFIGRTETEFSEKRLGKAGRASSSRLPVMTAEQVADAILKATKTGKKAVTLRWLDRLLIAANVIAPNQIGRRAMRQYK